MTTIAPSSTDSPILSAFINLWYYKTETLEFLRENPIVEENLSVCIKDLEITSTGVRGELAIISPSGEHHVLTTISHPINKFENYVEIYKPGVFLLISCSPPLVEAITTTIPHSSVVWPTTKASSRRLKIQGSPDIIATLKGDEYRRIVRLEVDFTRALTPLQISTTVADGLKAINGLAPVDGSLKIVGKGAVQVSVTP